MDLSLEPDEVTLLREILSNYLSDLRMEISNTENYELRESLKRDEETIKSLLARLGPSGPAQS
jgi:hypothetical protein